ncbi:MAG: hypothetical protein H7X80_11570, partial [bacterium]|nr:hypothetical protein [Candidatus Kapabacteria bacterium]
MKISTTILRSAALIISWATVSGIASVQAQGTELAIGGVEETGYVVKDAGVSAEAVERMGEWLGTIDMVRGGLESNDGFIRSDDELVLAFLFKPMEGESMLLHTYMNSVVSAIQTV